MNSKNEISILNLEPEVQIRRIIKVRDVEFEEEFLSELLSNYFSRKINGEFPKLSDALNIYLNESHSSGTYKFQIDAINAFNNFVNLNGNLYLYELRHIHICNLRDHLLQQDLKPVTVRKQTAILNAMLNLAFKHLDINRLSPFRGLRIAGEGRERRPMRTITPELIQEVKKKLLFKPKQPYKLIGLMQLNTGMRLSEPVFAKREDCVLDHPIPHIWIRRNELSDRKTKSSIRAIPLIGISLWAAGRLVELAKEQGSEWLTPSYAHLGGNSSCSAIMNKYLAELEFRSHMFRHALIDRMKAQNNISIPLAESITGHASRFASEFQTYGTIGYTLEQKLDVLKRIEI
ncbi:tyrosine-type recombinase/integrase [Limnohabitans sp. 63ED37-2]|uniref:tyrosine-type recombinase/integrase n=1 Tax=Limnohabitans sp. 63ED37-2 TaxID=1678128 RepID=UPI00070679CF|nr:tyrosine-type recombinase/integrase [Limnohabitans sp. 63ED37-2]ALK89156.1 Phage integrase family protein [Limnohabitans sp. 63ED37-2]